MQTIIGAFIFLNITFTLNFFSPTFPTRKWNIWTILIIKALQGSTESMGILGYALFRCSILPNFS